MRYKVCDVSDLPPVEKKIDEIEEMSKAAQDQFKFLRSRATKIVADARKEADAKWDEIYDLVKDTGLLPPGFTYKGGNGCHLAVEGSVLYANIGDSGDGSGLPAGLLQALKASIIKIT